MQMEQSPTLHPQKPQINKAMKTKNKHNNGNRALYLVYHKKSVSVYMYVYM